MLIFDELYADKIPEDLQIAKLSGDGIFDISFCDSSPLLVFHAAVFSKMVAEPAIKILQDFGSDLIRIRDAAIGGKIVDSFFIGVKGVFGFLVGLNILGELP